jgi:hypothetical protein
MRLVLLDFLANRLPNLALVRFNVSLRFTSNPAPHWLALLTTLPFRLPLVQRTARLMVLPILRQTILASVISEVISDIFMPISRL